MKQQARGAFQLPTLTIYVALYQLLQLSMDDNGDPGSTDTLAVTVNNSAGGLWFTSNWNGTRTIEQLLSGGNLSVR